MNAYAVVALCPRTRQQAPERIVKAERMLWKRLFGDAERSPCAPFLRRPQEEKEGREPTDSLPPLVQVRQGHGGLVRGLCREGVKMMRARVGREGMVAVWRVE